MRIITIVQIIKVNNQPAGWLRRVAQLMGLASLVLAACGQTESARYSGYAEVDLIYLASSGSGLLRELKVSRGDQVASGDALFALDAETDSYALDAAKAQQSQAQARLADLKKGVRKNELEALLAQIAQAKAALEISSSQLARTRDLAAHGFASAQSLIDLQSAQERDAARVAELQADLATAQDRARPDAITAARAELDAAQARVAQADWQRLQKARRAPQNAQVFDVLYRIGEWVPAGSPVVALLPDAAVKLRFFVPEPDLALVRVGQAVRYACDGCTGGMAQVSYVSPRAEFTPPVIYSNESRGKLVFLVEAKPDAQGMAQLKPGQPLTVSLPN